MQNSQNADGVLMGNPYSLSFQSQFVHQVAAIAMNLVMEKSEPPLTGDELLRLQTSVSMNQSGNGPVNWLVIVGFKQDEEFGIEAKQAILTRDIADNFRSGALNGYRDWLAEQIGSGLMAMRSFSKDLEASCEQPE